MSETPPSAAPDDATIADDDVLYRRIHESHVQEIDGVLRPRSGAFEDKEDGISVFLRSVLIAERLTPADVLINYPGRLLVQLFAADVRYLVLADGSAAVCGITRDPDPPDTPPHPCSAAHGLIHLPERGKARRKKAERALAMSAYFVDKLAE